MKKNLQIVFFILVQLSGLSMAQNLTQTEIDSIINDLYSDDWYVVDNATISIIDNTINEALPTLKDNFWNQSLNSRISYLEAMKALQSQETLSYGLALFDTLQYKTYQGIDTVYKKLYLIDELFDLGDFSKIDYLDYCTINFVSKSNLEFCIQLWGRLLSYPNYTLLAKNKLFEFIPLDSYPEARYKAMSWLEDYYIDELSHLMINRYHLEDYYIIKFTIIRKYTPYVDFETVSNLLKYILVNDTDTICKQIAYEKLLTDYRTPSNYVYVMSWLNDESSYFDFKELNKVYEKYICPGTPFYPDSTASIEEIIDSTNSYVSQSEIFNWLSDLNFSNELKSMLTTAKTNLQAGDSLACRVQVKAFQDLVDNVYKDSLNTDPRFVTIEGWKFLYWNAQYILDRLPEPPATEGIKTYSVFSTHGVWLEQNSEVISGNIGVNEIGQPPFMDSDVELSIGISTVTPSGYSVKANRIKVKQSATVNGDVYYNELDNNSSITGRLNTPLDLPLSVTLPEFHTSTLGTENIIVPESGEYTLPAGAYGDILIKKNGKLIFTGGEYQINKFTGGENNLLLFQSVSEVRIKDKFDSGQGSYIGPSDTTTQSADEIIFYVEGINGNNGNLGATPKAAKIGISNTVKANFYVPNGTLWIRQNSKVEGAFIGKDIDVGIGVQLKLNSAFRK